MGLGIRDANRTSNGGGRARRVVGTTPLVPHRQIHVFRRPRQSAVEDHTLNHRWQRDRPANMLEKAPEELFDGRWRRRSHEPILQRRVADFVERFAKDALDASAGGAGRQPPASARRPSSPPAPAPSRNCRQTRWVGRPSRAAFRVECRGRRFGIDVRLTQTRSHKSAIVPPYRLKTGESQELQTLTAPGGTGRPPVQAQVRRRRIVAIPSSRMKACAALNSCQVKHTPAACSACHDRQPALDGTCGSCRPQTISSSPSMSPHARERCRPSALRRACRCGCRSGRSTRRADTSGFSAARNARWPPRQTPIVPSRPLHSGMRLQRVERRAGVGVEGGDSFVAYL